MINNYKNIEYNFITIKFRLGKERNKIYFVDLPGTNLHAIQARRTVDVWW